jgi:hypothetical protein
MVVLPTPPFELAKAININECFHTYLKANKFKINIERKLVLLSTNMFVSKLSFFSGKRSQNPSSTATFAFDYKLSRLPFERRGN